MATPHRHGHTSMRSGHPGQGVRHVTAQRLKRRRRAWWQAAAPPAAAQPATGKPPVGKGQGHDAHGRRRWRAGGLGGSAAAGWRLGAAARQQPAGVAAAFRAGSAAAALR
ncbi:unnamed protein product [Miscanthus lutarioriparius]|uniref:Uncharacterized protein n=1 Tax=Miscanthus lutarioriparius TaxID=422564 RepID=A0A811R4Z1_9POAL|nr:unnamed protein product [Miscanthus lutarioriparius]